MTVEENRIRIGQLWRRRKDLLGSSNRLTPPTKESPGSRPLRGRRNLIT